MKTLLLFSALCFLSITTLKAQVPNNGFEDWENDLDGNWNPKFWTTSSSTPDTNVFQYTPAYAGNYSMQLSTMSVGGGFVLPGMATITYLSNDRPTQMTVCMQSTVATGDQILIYYSSWRNDTIIAAVGDCSFHIDSTMSQFNCITFPISYLRDVMIPDTAQIMILVGNFSTAQVGTSLIVDDITFSGFNNGINEAENNSSATLLQNYPNPLSTLGVIPISLIQNSNVVIKIFDMHGREVKTIADKFMTSGHHNINLSVNELPKGFYYYNAKGENFNLTKKFIVD